jgi:hypothetical protein
MFLIQRDDVRSELVISARQREQMDQERQKVFEQMRANRPDPSQFQNLSPEERRARMEEFRNQMQNQARTMNDQMAQKVEAVLTPAQQKRLGELDLQWRGPLALADEKVASIVRLTPDQQRQVGNIIAEYRTGQQQVMQNAFQGFGGRGQRGQGQGGDPGAGPGGQGGQGGRPQFNPEEMRTRMDTAQKEVEKIRKACGDKVVLLLSAEQKQTWKAAQGKPFTFRATEQGPPRVR